MLKNTIQEAEKRNKDIAQENIIEAFMKFVGIPDRSYIDDKLQVSSKLTEKEAGKAKTLIQGPFMPWIHCEGDAKELEIKLEILLRNQIKTAFFHEYMFLGEQKLDLIKNYIKRGNKNEIKIENRKRHVGNKWLEEKTKSSSMEFTSIN
jgi:hypothetical protein